MKATLRFSWLSISKTIQIVVNVASILRRYLRSVAAAHVIWSNEFAELFDGIPNASLTPH